MSKLPKIFSDSSNIEEIEILIDLGIISGITTNPLIVAREAGDFEPNEYYQKLAKRFPALPISIQLLNDSIENLLSQARKYAKISPNIVVKIPMFADGKGLRLISTLAEEGIPTNVTAVMSANQAALSLIAGRGKGPQYISLFYNRIKDGGGDPEKEITSVRNVIDHFESDSEIIAGSIRSGEDVYKASICGAHIITVAPKIIRSMIEHSKSIEFINQSQKAWEDFIFKKPKKQIASHRKIAIHKSSKFATA